MSGHNIRESLENAYNSVITWKPNLFRLPSGSVGKEFVEEITSIVNHFIKNTEMQSVAMKALMVIGPLLLQKPSKSSKNKEHISHLKDRLTKWKCGNLTDILNEGNAIQKRLLQGNITPLQHEKVFVRLMLQGKVGAALKWISASRTGVHDITPDTVTKLRDKHPQNAPPIYQRDFAQVKYIPPSSQKLNLLFLIASMKQASREQPSQQKVLPDHLAWIATCGGA